ncbi:MAG TPA: hypothetical protein VNM72_10290 [Blastocatellia bacterium]|nr:hypothetical protein [Blastocatellia bacterium]
MPEPERHQRLSSWGVLSLLVVGVILYVLVRSGDFLLLYGLATGALCLFLLIVAFDIGLDDQEEER